MKENSLTVPHNVPLRPSGSLITDMPDTVLGTDMNKTRSAQGWDYVYAVLDWGEKDAPRA